MDDDDYHDRGRESKILPHFVSFLQQEIAHETD
jgi:hypothetical protein